MSERSATCGCGRSSSQFPVHGSQFTVDGPQPNIVAYQPYPDMERPSVRILRLEFGQIPCEKWPHDPNMVLATEPVDG